MDNVAANTSYAVYKTAAESDESRKARIDSIIEKFKPLLDLKPTNEYYHNFIYGPWLVRTNNCVLNLNLGFTTITASFYPEDSTQDIQNIMIGMLEHGEKKFAELKTLIDKSENDTYKEYKRIKEITLDKSDVVEVGGCDPLKAGANPAIQTK